MDILIRSRCVRVAARVAGFLVGLLLNGAVAQAQGVSLIEPPDVWRLKHLTGQSGPAFTLYGCPRSLEEVKHLVARMKEIGPEERPCEVETISFFGRRREKLNPVPPPDLCISAAWRTASKMLAIESLTGSTKHAESC